MAPERSQRLDRPLTVLVVEDEPGVLSLTKRVLERAGYRVIAHDSSIAALDWWSYLHNREQVDVVLSDVVMPVMSGPDMITRMRLARPTVVALLMSGNDRNPETPYPFLAKPFTPAGLVDTVRALVEPKSGAA